MTYFLQELMKTREQGMQKPSSGSEQLLNAKKKNNAEHNRGEVSGRTEIARVPIMWEEIPELVTTDTKHQKGELIAIKVQSTTEEALDYAIQMHGS